MVNLSRTLSTSLRDSSIPPGCAFLKRGSFCRFVLTVYFLAMRVLIASQGGLELRSPSNKQLDASPGHIVTASVVVANQGREGGELSDVMTLPPGCLRVAPIDLPFNLAPGGQTVRVLAIAVPNNMPSGQCTLRYAVRSRQDPSSADTIEFTLNVTTVDKLELFVEPLSSPVLAGDSYPVKLHVTNNGNSSIAVQLSSRSSHHFPIRIEPAAFSLTAGATRELVCFVDTSKDFTQHTSHAVTFDVAATSHAGKKLTASQASVAEIIPLVSGDKEKTFHKLPIQTRITAIAETHHNAQLQGELSGEGSLDEQGRHMISFLFRGPDIQNANLFGERDQYGMEYHGDNLDLQLGDRIYALSPLTEKGSFGRGAGIGWHQDGMAAGVFTMSSRYRQHNTDEIGAFLRQDITQELSVQGSFLRKSGADSGFSSLSAWRLPQDIAAIEARYHLGKALDLRVEGGLSHTDRGGNDNAYRIEARGELPQHFTYALEHTHAGPNFDGYYSGNDLTYLSIGHDITTQLRVHASFSRYTGNPALNDILSTVVNSENSWNAGAIYAVTKTTELSLDYNHVQREDILLPAAYKFTEDSLRFGVGHNFGRLNAHTFVDVGDLDNTLNGQSGSFVRYTAILNWRPTDSQTYSAFVNYGPSPFTGTSDKSVNAGLSASWKFSDKLSATVSYARNQYDGLTGTQQDQAMVTLRRQFENKSSLSLIGRWTHGIITGVNAGQVTNESALLVSYSVPFDIAVSRKTSLGALEGRLTEAAPGSSRGGLARVVIQVGNQYAATDETGRFSFPALTPGRYQLLVMPDSLGPRMTMVTGLPMQLTINPAQTTRLELTATAASSLSICVRRYEFADGNEMNTSGALKPVGGQEGVAIEIENGHETWRAQTDRLGCAAFDRLLPGPWRIRFAASDLPALCSIENSERTVTLKPGENSEALARVVPQKRTFKMLDSGTIR
ncbi:MAG: hypothetical protein JWO89_1071 [Verrucomicrobiaceae bacterium]|nr:hypothetical protein [Verrucomicrobiaceae bacterium]